MNDDIILRKIDKTDAKIDSLTDGLNQLAVTMATYVESEKSSSARVDKLEAKVDDHEVRIRSNENDKASTTVKWKIMAWIAGIVAGIIIGITVAIVKPLMDSRNEATIQQMEMSQQLSEMIKLMATR